MTISRFAFAALAALALSACTQKQAALKPGAGEPTLDAIRAATEKFKDVNAALAAGYVRDPMNMCATAEMTGHPAADGAMGVHYIRMDLVGVTEPPNPLIHGTGTYTDFHMPAILMYEPQADGSMVLVGVENLVFEDAWKASGKAEPPTFYGQPYNRMADDPNTPVDEAHHFVPHFDRHVWLYRDNPKGVFAQYNPNVTCKHHKGGTPMPM